MTNDREATCVERIAGQMANRAETFGDLFTVIDNDEERYDDARNEMDELPLSVEVVKTIKVLLSTGGPADGLTIELDRDGNVSTVRYWFSDWFDHAETTVDQDSPLWRYAEELAELEWGMDR